MKIITPRSWAAVLLGLWAGCGGAPPCGQGTEEKDGLCVATAQAVPEAQRTGIKLTYLKLDHSPAQPLYVNNPVHVTVGVTSTGAKRVVNLSVGLIKKRPDGAAVDPKTFAELPGCFLGGGETVLSGAGAEQRFEYDLVVAHDCLRSDKPATVNPTVFFDMDGQSGEQDNVIILTPANAARQENQACRSISPVGDPVAGCAVDLTLKPSPGVDVALTSLAPQSSIAVLYPHTTPRDLRPGTREDFAPVLTVEQHGTAYGRDIDEHDGDLLPDVFEIYYDLQAPESADPRWVPLFFNGGASYLERPRLVPNTVNREQIDLYVQDEAYTLLTMGAWAAQENFLVRGCMKPKFTERGDEFYGGDDGKANNCQTVRVKLVKAQPRGQSADEYSVGETWSNFYGSARTIGTYGSASTKNVVNLGGAESSSEAYLRINPDSFIGQLDLVRLWGRGSVPVSIVNSEVDIGVQVLGFNLYTFYRKIPEYHYDNDDLKYSKELCKSFTYYALPLINPTIQICAGGSIALPVEVAITGKDQPGMTPPKVGSVEVTVTPTATFTGTVRASISLLVVRGGVEGILTLFGVKVPTVGELTWGLTRLAPPRLAITGRADCDVTINVLGGEANAFIDTWSFWDGWGRKGTYNICSWNGWSWTWGLIHRGGTLTLGQ